MTTSRINYYIDPRSFLARAREHMAQFEEGRSASDFFYAALQLRFGIEARVKQYLDVANEGAERPGRKPYSATDLLAELSKESPHAEQQVEVRISDEQSGSQFGLVYTPVRRSLARRHGRLGAFLHFRFFKDNPVWFIDTPHSGPDGKTLITHLELLKEMADELEEACRGTLTYPGMRVSDPDGLNTESYGV